MTRLILLCLMFTAMFALAMPQEGTYKLCTNSGGPNTKTEMRNCHCQQATRDDCDQKPETNMPGCGTNCKPENCKCTPEKCS